MKKKILCLGLAAGMGLSIYANAADYVIDTKGAHASVNFKISHLGYSFIVGRFDDFSGKFSFDPSNVAASSVNISIDTESVDTNHAERDKHIRSGDFLEVSKYPKASFTSTKVIDKGNGLFDIQGDLTLHGKTKPITIVAAEIGAGKDPWGGERAGFSGLTRIELADFGIPVMGPASYADMQIYVEGVKQ